MLKWRWQSFVLVLLGALVFLEASVAFADGPFFAYPPYGSHRGRIVTRNGLLVDKQRIRWGNGVTNNGVAVFHDAFAAAVPIVQALAPLTRDAEIEETRSRQERDVQRRAAEEEDGDWQRKANSLFARNQALLAEFTGTGPVVPTPPQGGNGDWDNTGAGPAQTSGEGSTSSVPTANNASLAGWDNTNPKSGTALPSKAAGSKLQQLEEWQGPAKAPQRVVPKAFSDFAQ